MCRLSGVFRPKPLLAAHLLIGWVGVAQRIISIKHQNALHVKPGSAPLTKVTVRSERPRDNSRGVFSPGYRNKSKRALKARKIFY